MDSNTRIDQLSAEGIRLLNALEFSEKAPAAVEIINTKPNGIEAPPSTPRLHRKRSQSSPKAITAEGAPQIRKHNVAPLDLERLKNKERQAEDLTVPLSSKRVTHSTDKHLPPRRRNSTQRAKSDSECCFDPRNLSSSEARGKEIPSLTLMSPRLKARRAELFASDAEDVTPLDLLHLNMLKEGSESAAFNKSFKANFKQAWDLQEKPLVSSTEIERSIRLACRSELEALFNQQQLISIEEFYSSEFQRTNEVLNIIKKNGTPLIYIVKRLKLMHAETRRLLRISRSKTEFTELFYQTIEKLLAQDFLNKSKIGLNKGRKLSTFLKVVDEINTNHKYKKIKSLIKRGFGDSDKNIKEVLSALKSWNTPSEPLIMSLKNEIDALSKRLVKIRAITYISHDWKEKALGLNPFDKMRTEDIFKSFKNPQGNIIFDTIAINGMVFHDRNGIMGKAYNHQTSDYKFFLELFTLLKQALGETNQIFMETRGQVKTFIDRYSDLRAMLVNDEAQIPCLKVLKLASQQSWKIAEQFISFLYPQLFPPVKEPFYICKPLDRSENEQLCDIVIEKDLPPVVTLTNVYGIFPVHYHENQAIVHTFRRLAKIPFSWSISCDEKSWHGKLRICNGFAIEAGATEHEKWALLNSIINYTETPFRLRK